jgi:hypothetical protein
MKVTHMASCHCKRVRFQVLSRKSIKVMNYTCKLRFPRLIISSNDFEMISDGTSLSMYPVFTHTDADGDTSSIDVERVGIHTFCSFCGMQILYSPSLNPKEVHINLDCLSKENINHIANVHRDISETIACPITYDPVSQIRRQGLGAQYVPSMQSLTNYPGQISANNHNHDQREEDSLPLAQTLWSIASERLSYRSTSDASAYEEVVVNNQDVEDTTTEYFSSPTGSINGDIVDSLPASGSVWDSTVRNPRPQSATASAEQDYLNTRQNYDRTDRALSMSYTDTTPRRAQLPTGRTSQMMPPPRYSPRTSNRGQRPSTLLRAR